MNYKNVKAYEIKDWAIKNLNNVDPDFDYYGNESFLYEKIIKADYLEDYNLIMKDNEIFDIFFVSDFYGIPVINPSWYNLSNNEELFLLFELYPNSIINLGEYPCFYLDNTDIVLLNLNNGVNTYCLSSCYTFVTKKENEFILKNKFEEIFFFKDFSVSDIKFSYLNDSELNQKLNENKIDLFEIPYWRTKYGMQTYCGFHYFTNEYDDSANYLVATYLDNIVGIIKVGTYSDYKIHQAIDYIDIRCDFKKNGLAKKMIKELNNYLKTELPLIISEESEEGKICHIFDMFKTYITNNEVIKSSNYRMY